jgi:hypothetical protein
MTIEIQVFMAADLPSPSVKLWVPLEHAAPAATVSLTQDAERKGLYRGTVTDLAGWYTLDKFSGSSLLGSSWINIDAAEGEFIESDPRVLTVIKAKTELIGSVPFSSSGGALSPNDPIQIKIGDRRVLTLTSMVEDFVGDLTGVTVRFGLRDMSGNQLVSLSNVEVLVPTGLQSVRVVLLPSLTIGFPVASGYFDVQAEFAADNIVTFLTGSFNTVADYSGVAPPD